MDAIIMIVVNLVCADVVRRRPVEIDATIIIVVNLVNADAVVRGSSETNAIKIVMRSYIVYFTVLN